MDRERHAWLRALTLLADALALALTWGVVVYVRAGLGGGWGLPALPAPLVLSLGWLIVPIWLGVLATRHPRRSGTTTVTSSGLALLLALALLFLARIEINRTLLLGFSACSVPALLLSGGLTRRWLALLPPHRIALVGAMPDRAALIEALQRLEPRIEIVLCLEPSEAHTLGQRLHRVPADEVFVAGELPTGALIEVARATESLGMPLSLDATFLGLRTQTAELQQLDGWTAITFTATSDASPARLLKRGIDVVGATVGLLLGAIPLLGLMLLIRLADGGPALYTAERVGRFGRPFKMFKLRSMVIGAEDQRESLLAHNEIEGPAFKMRDDPRITPLGLWLRRLSLDELPQLINVLKGEMSLVGPRPPLPDEVARYTRWQRRRLSIRPGMTGLWQVSGRADLPFERWMALDLHYIDNWSLWLDLSLLLRTVPAVLSGTGAR